MSQEQRLIAVEGLTEDLRLISFSGREEMSRLFSYSLRMGSGRESIDAKKIIGKQAAIRILMPDGQEQRYISGIISRFSADFAEEGGTVYRAELVPSLWLLTQTSDCRIFQDMTVKQIIEKVLGDQGISNFETKDLRGNYPKLEYCVQFRETDFNFLSRLMEQFGIFYYFRHEQQCDRLIIADNVGAYFDLSESKVNFAPTRQESEFVHDHVFDWRHDYEFVAGKWSQTDYDFKKPGSNLMTDEKTVLQADAMKPLEKYDFPGEYSEVSDGKSLAKVRMEEEELAFDQATGASSCRSFAVGGKFQFDKQVPPDEKGNIYVIVGISHRGHVSGAYASGAEVGGVEYSNTFRGIKAETPFRPARVTPKPVAAMQSAVVTGPENEEIYCDKYGRVKVQFHWDREVQNKKTQSNPFSKRSLETSSCWIRTSHSIAGKKWGFVAIPRIGQEVVVDFLDGDPDRPLITGSVYNEEQPPHYKLPLEKTKTYIKTNSTKGGDGHNELMFDDQDGQEQLYLHAERNMDVRVKKDSKTIIHGDRHQIIGQEQDGQKSGDQRELVYQDKHLNIKRNHVEHIEGNMQLMVGKGDAQSGGHLHLVVENNRLESVGGNHNLTVDGQHNEKIKGNLSTQVGGDWQTKVDGKIAHQAGPAGEVHIAAGAKVIIEAGIQLSLVGPGGFIDIGPAGIAIQGVMVNINSGGSAGSGSGCSPDAAELPEEAAPVEPTPALSSDSGMKSCD
ncbi:MAG: type VI secretion system tip protein VgrG [bacterium]|nr:type VI secretion system tip protein VgrG [bacterium]